MANADPISETAARSVGAKFLHANAVLKTADPSALQRVSTYRTTNGTPAFYVFNGEKAFVIVSADDCATPVLGYSSEGRFVAEEIPVQMEEYLQGFVKQIQYGIENHLRGDELTVRQWELVKATGCVTEEKNPTVVAPLIQATWGQSGNYNDMCPSDSQGQALVGCVAVAMGQIMHYWGYPANGYGSHDYYPSGYPHQEVDFGAAVYDWANMPNSLDGATATQINAVATLLWHCGVAVNMIYGYNTSGAYSVDVPYAMLNYFSYSDDLYGAYQSYYDNATWIEMLKSSLDSEKPVYYSGQDTNGLGGHAFICDGYDASNFFHFNWGWYGMEQDTYFAINALNVANYQFNDSQYAIFNIHPDCTVGASYQISTSVNTAGGTVSGAGSYGCSSMCTLTASPSEGYMFCSWTENGVMVSVDPSYSFIVTGNRNLEANFMQMDDDICTIVFELQDSYGDGWNGNALVVNYSDGCYESDQLTFNAGSSATFTRHVLDGSHISLSWLTGSYSNECSFTVSYEYSSQIISATNLSSGFAYEFDVDCAGNAPAYYEVTAYAVPEEGGSVSGEGSYVAGQLCTLVATANIGYSFTHWTKNGSLVSYSPSFSFVVNEDASYEAHFGAASFEQVHAEYYPNANNATCPNVKVSWEVVDPEPPVPTNGQWHYYDNGSYLEGVGTSGGQFYWGVMFPPGSYEGNVVTKVAAYDREAMTGTLTIYNDGVAAPESPVGSMNIGFTGANQMVEFVFPEPIIIDPSKNVWVVISNESGAMYPAAACSNTGDPNGRWVSIDGVTWTDVLSYGLEDTFIVRAYIASVASKGEPAFRDLSYDFEDGTFQGWTCINADGDLYGWELGLNLLGQGYGHNGSNGLAVSRSYVNDVGPLTPDNYLVSPAVTLGGSISFYACGQDASWASEHFGVAVSTTNNTNASAFTTIKEWTMTAKDDLNAVPRGEREQGNWYYYTVDLSAYAGQTGYVAIRHFNCSDMFYLDVDDIVISQPDRFFSIMRTTADNNGPYTVANTVLLADGVVGSPYIDTSWANLASGTYKFGVSMSTPEGVVLDTLWSNHLEKVASYSITASANPSQGGSVSGAGSFAEGETCTLVATSSSNYDFVNWTRNGVTVSENATYSFTVNESAAYVANFQLKQYLVTVAAEPVEGGTVSGGGNFNAGAICTLQANANEGYSFDHWTKNGVTIPNGSSFSFNVTEDATYIAFFILKTYSVSVKADPEVGAVVTGSDVYQHGATATVSVIPNAHYVFDHWTLNGSVLPQTSLSYSFVVTQSCDIVAYLNYINDVNENSDAFVLFPNPVEKGSEVHIELPEASGSVVIEMVDRLGRVVFSGQSDTSCTVSSATLAPGVYAVVLRTDEGCLVKKLLVR